MDSPLHNAGLEEATPHFESQPYFFKMYEVVKSVIHRDVRNECKEGFILTWPISLSMVLIFMIPILTLIFIGHYRHSHLAAVGLAFSFSILFGLSLVSGLASTCITLASPAFAAGNKKLAGVALQKTFALSAILMFPLTGLWINAGKIFNLLRQGEEISSTAQEFLIYYLPALLLQNTHAILHRFLASQSIVLPSIWCVFAGLVLHLIFTYTLLFLLDMGVKGAAIAADLTWFLVNLFLLIYMKYSGLLAGSWPGASAAWLLDWGKFFWLALPSIAMLFIEIAAFQYGTFFLGSISDLQLEIHIIFYYIALVMFANAHGMSNAASVRVGSVLAVGDQRTLKITFKAQLFNVCFVCCSFGVLLIVIKDVIGYLFTNRSDVVSSASHGIPVLACFIVLDSVQAVLGGVLQGAGLQRFSAAVNLIGYVVIAIPTGSVLATAGKLGTLGYWIGLTGGAVAQVLILSLILWTADFKKRSSKARRRAGIFDDDVEDDNISEMRTFTLLTQQTSEKENNEEDRNTDTLTTVSDDQFFVATDTEATLTRSLIFRRVIVLVASVCCLFLGIIFALKAL